ncbi:calcineurin-like phosphoesterase family protein [Glaciecola petra]|uniref:Calcineurin-like phosphoesterase family protein n=1 Tax=Glaciecola petra TaxID=3075602 RepID=A0ABU2ZRZ8_9ALTE|nr:calcineurin-like phosphoesterase family protein [Aestuariibacter sp. P117]MDT0595408.1 calcineurin-like phosphoesterase family protein [Aestuariibacter sp. P117]
MFLLACVTTLLSCANTTNPVPTKTTTLQQPYFADIQVIREETANSSQLVKGRVFHDENGNGVFDIGEPGIADVAVSNGIHVALSDKDGRYSLAEREDMSVFVVQPTGWRVPTNQDYVPQFAYQHKPKGSPKALRFGGLAPTGSLPSEINFPLKPVHSNDFNCAILGDTQTYANQDISFFRDSTVDDLLDRGHQLDCIIAVGDVMGDDLGLIPRMADILGTLKAPQWWTHGNHDFDFDADFDKDSADSWRNLWGPAYYAFEQGNVLFIVLDNVIYPCGPDDARLPGREYCVDDENKRYNGRISDEQMQFVEALIKVADEQKTIVFAHHIPFVTFYDQQFAAHQTDNVNDLYALVEGRQVLSLAGHTHTIENLSPGDSFKGWKEVVGVNALPFRHIIAGAGSGAWYQGDFDIHGTPMSLQRLGAPKGWLELTFDAKGNYKERYYGANQGRERAAWLSISTPGFRTWFEQIQQWRHSERSTREEVPPLSINDLPDVKILTSEDLKNGSFITANIWAGSSDTQVSISINGATSHKMTRTQEAKGEEARVGAMYADPFAAQRQLSVSRWALESRSGQDANQGFQLFKGYQYGPDVPQPQGAVADRNMHLWKYELPKQLPFGAHVAEVNFVDRHGRMYTDRIAFEVRQERPQMRFRREVWQAFENGAPVR